MNSQKMVSVLGLMSKTIMMSAWTGLRKIFFENGEFTSWTKWHDPDQLETDGEFYRRVNDTRTTLKYLFKTLKDPNVEYTEA